MEDQEKIPGGWNSQMEATNTQCDPCPVEGTIKEKEMIPGGWNKKKCANDTQHDPGPVAGAMEAINKIFVGCNSNTQKDPGPVENNKEREKLL